MILIVLSGFVFPLPWAYTNTDDSKNNTVKIIGFFMFKQIK